jgi:threonine dehydratase
MPTTVDGPTITPIARTPSIRLSNLFPRRDVYAKCEFLAPSGCFKIRGAVNLLENLRRAGKTGQLIVPSMGNTALGAATAAQAFGFRMTGVVPQTIARAKDEKLRALGVELIKITGGGSDLLRCATELADERGGYFVHPHLDSLWTDGYQSIAAEVLDDVPDCRSLVFPVGGGGLLMGLLAYLQNNPAPVRLFGCEPYNYPKYANFDHARSTTIADGLILETPHPQVQQAISEAGVAISLVQEVDIRVALKVLFEAQALAVEPSSAIALAFVEARAGELEEPICVILTGENIARDDHRRLISAAQSA